MELTLECKTLLGSTWVFSGSLESRGVVHGFLGAPLDFSPGGREASSASLCGALHAERVVMLHQTHGATVVDSQHVVGDAMREGDAWLIPLNHKNPTNIYGIKTADCVPIILAGEHFGAIVHAGWRGLANAIIERSVEALRARGEGKQLVALVGPCAGGPAYEVGAEVREAIGAQACVVNPQQRSTENQKMFLDLETTALKKLADAGISRTASSKIYTLSDPRYFSARRDGPAGGRNLSFVVA